MTGYLGYFILNAIWGTYYSVPPTFKETNVVVIAVGLSAALYLIGVVLAYLSIFHVTDYKVPRRNGTGACAPSKNALFCCWLSRYR